MDKIKIAVLDGDGIGPEVVEQAKKVMDAVGNRFGHHFEYCHALVGAIAIDHTGDPLPQETLDTCVNADAVLFGAIGHPKYDNDPSAKVRPEQGLLRMRKELGLYANLRPVTIYPSLRDLAPLRPDRLEGVDMLIVRELIGGIYFGERGRSEDRKSAYDTCSYSWDEVERISRLAFEQAGLRRKKLTLVDKANVLESSRLWREVVQAISPEYPDIAVDYLFVDNAAMQLILNPAQFDVVVTSNMFGDILSDAASVLAGSLGLLPSASIGARTSVFEPIHGSYPQAAGQDRANPLATILSAAMLLDNLDLNEEAQCVRDGVSSVLEKGLGTEDIKPQITIGCAEMGDIVAHIVEDPDAPNLRAEKISDRLSTII
ncbi:MAG: 3-isopropylmalate dehydrogenase [Lewinella sp.]|nr:3-isopropylmalate dehydrogenase [Lewinella sp.]